jgi:two-component system NarL family sensor kinase
MIDCELRPMRQLLINTLFLLVLSTLLTQAQTDTLTVRLARVKEPVARVNELIELGRSLRAKVPQKSDSLLLLAVKESGVLKDQAIHSNALSTLGNSLNERGEVDSAAVLFRLAETISTKCDDPRGVAIALTGMGNNRIYRGDMPGAMDYFLRAIRVAEQTGDSSYVAASLSNIGWTYYNNDQLSDAEKFTHRALNIYYVLGDSTGMAQSFNNLGIFMAEKGEFDSSLVFMQRSLDLRIRLNILKDIPWNHSNLGGLLILMGRPADGLVHLAKAAEAFERIGQMRGAVSALNNLAAANNEMGRHDECIRISLQAETKARALQMRDLVRDAYENITSAHFNKKDFRMAFEMQERFMALKDSLVNEKSSQRMAELQALYETEKKQHEIDRLSTEAELKELRIGRQRTQIGILGIGLLATLLLSGIGYVWYRQRQRTRLNAILIEQQELRLKAIIEAQEDERKRIAKDLHDGTVQTLTGLKMRWERLGTQLSLTGSVADDFGRSLTILTEAGNEVRAISHQMMPRSLQETGLVPALADMLDRSLGSTAISYQFEHHKVDGERFKETVEVSLYRIAQELINNIIKHSGAKAVSVQLMRVKDQLILIVEDDGKGFKVEDAEARNGIGLMNITSRIKAVNGEMHYEPSHMQGTVATIRVPV